MAQRANNNPAKSWCLTINNYNDADVQKLTDLDGITYLVYGKEVGEEEKTPHLQVCFTLKNATRFKALKKLFPNAHIETTKDVQGARNYCMKDGDYTIVDNRQQGKRTDIDEVMKLAKVGKYNEIMNNHPRDWFKYSKAIQECMFVKDVTPMPEWVPGTERKVVWLWGKTGVGKTRFVYDNHDFDEVWSWAPNKSGFFNGYENQPVVVFDDIRSDDLKFNYILRLTDRYPLYVNVKGGTRKWNASTIYFTAPQCVDDFFSGVGEAINQFKRRLAEERELTVPKTNKSNQVIQAYESDEEEDVGSPRSQVGWKPIDDPVFDFGLEQSQM